VANKTVITVKKNKVAPPFAEAHVMIRFGQGISKLDEILDLGLRYKKITQTGSYFKMGDTTLGQGREKTLEFLEANPKIASEIESDVRTGLGIA
jgi:recombination protein RecA